LGCGYYYVILLSLPVPSESLLQLFEQRYLKGMMP
jgi:hypothetical protein